MKKRKPNGVLNNLSTEDAAFIVRACNSHEALVAALESLCRDAYGSGWASYAQGLEALILAKEPV